MKKTKNGQPAAKNAPAPGQDVPPLRNKRLLALGAACVVCVAAVAAVLVVRHQRRFDMPKELLRIADAEGIWDNQWDQNQAKISSLAQDLQRETDPPRRFQLEREMANQYVFANAPEGAIVTLEKLQKEFEGKLPPDALEAVQSDLAFAYFRMGEIENCTSTAQHNPDSCLFPIRGKGVHQRRLGATEAVKRYGELLAAPGINPDSDNALSYRWLLNLGYMTLGQYPDSVPKQWLIPPSAFESDYDIGRFVDVAATRGVAEFGIAGGLVLEDFDNDGHLDMMISHMGVRDQMHYFHNDGNGNFTRMTEQAGLVGITGGLSMASADYDNDGCIDVLVVRGGWMHAAGKYPLSLLKNDCHGHFEDVTAEAGLLRYYPTQAFAWADFNGDGWLDLFIGNELAREHVDWPESAQNFHLFINNRDGTFTDVASQIGVQVSGWIKAATADDYDNDGWPDLYVSILGASNRLLHNKGVRGGVPQFEDVTEKAGVGEPKMSFSTWFFDYDNDGWPDIFVTGYQAQLPNIVREYVGDKEHAQGSRPRLYHNNHDGTFTDRSREMGIDRLLLTMGANYGDLDNDGWLDMYLGTGSPPLATLVPNIMFRNDQGRRFQDVTTSGGFGNLQKGHGVAFGDIDETGNQDVVEVMGGAFDADKAWTTIFKNPGHGNHWVKLRLVGTKANRFGVGARLRLAITDEGKKRELFRTVGTGGSFGASPVRPHIGLAQATAVDVLEVRWPGSGTVQRFTNLAADRTYEIREDRQEALLVETGVKTAARSTK